MDFDVRIERTPDTGSIQGSVVAAGETRIDFSGWLGLAAALGKLLDQPSATEPPRDGERGQ